MSKLKHLIETLHNQHQRGELNDLRDPDLVIQTLEELQTMTGNEDIKNSVASQTSHLLTMRHRLENRPMLNTAVYGPPGVGKTQFSIKLATIWYGLGYLKSPETRVAAEKEYNLDLIKGIIYIVIMACIMLWPAIRGTCAALGWYTLILVAMIGVSIYYFWPKDFQLKSYLYKTEESEEESPIESSSNDSIIKIVSREDFVGKYVGWSDKKTKALLEANRGKVLLIDEAYSLVLGPNDQYGIEAATTLNRYLSEHPDEIIVIFAGYEHELKTGLFRIQSGLIRRCMWTFSIPGYTPQELFNIFQTQLKKHKFTLSSPNRVKQLFIDNASAFPNFGGDTEKLCNYVLIQYSEDLPSPDADPVITVDHVRKGIEILRANTIQKVEKPSLEKILDQVYV